MTTDAPGEFWELVGRGVLSPWAVCRGHARKRPDGSVQYWLDLFEQVYRGRTKSEAILKFQIAHPGEKLYGAEYGGDPGPIDPSSVKEITHGA